MIPRNQRIVDTVLIALAKRALELSLLVKYPRSADQETWKIEDLRTSKVGSELAKIVSYIESEGATKEEAKQAIQEIMRLIFTGPFLPEDFLPPKGFYEDTELGQLMNKAHVQMYMQELLTPTDAHQRLEVSRQMLYDYITNGQLTPVYVGGRMMIVGSEVDHLKTSRKVLKKH